MWDNVGMSRSKESLTKALHLIPKLREDFYNNVNIPDTNHEFNSELEKASRLVDFIDLGELMAKDALDREESCGGHFREEHQTNENEAKRNDEDYAYVAAWQYKKDKHELCKEELKFENVNLQHGVINSEYKIKSLRQLNSDAKGSFYTYDVENVLEDMSFFEILDMLNNELIQKNESPIAFDHDCREGICGTCGVVINGRRMVL